jgi:pseudouridine-5'-phosphate glycosidase
MILIKHTTKEDLEKEDVKDFIAENIADLEQEDIYGNSVFSILTKKIVEFSGEEKVEFP